MSAVLAGGSVKKVFHLESAREHYHADAAVLWCFDHRFELVFRKFLKRIGIIHYDAIKVAGGAKLLTSPDREVERDFVLDQIRKSIRLHGTRLVILMLHSDCGAYGGLRAFGGDPASEAEHHRHELESASAKLKATIPQIKVQSYFVDFDGVWQIEICGDSRAMAST
jgi:carbonic anhydrase